MKQKCAKAAYEMIKDGMVIGLGGGRTIAFLIEELKNGNKKVKAVTPSEDTMNLCVKAGIEVLPLEFVKQIDIAFDGCNEIDKNLNALKTDGGIFTREKIVAVMAKDYVILADEEKYSDELTFEHAVAVEVIKSAKEYVKSKLEEMGAKVEERSTEMKMGTLFRTERLCAMTVGRHKICTSHVVHLTMCMKMLFIGLGRIILIAKFINKR